MDAGTKAANKELLRIKKKLNELYADALADLEKKLKKHLLKFAAQDQRKRQDLEAGKITRQQYQSWQMGQIFTGKLWRSKIRNISRTVVDFNKRAIKEIGKGLLRVFGIGMNYQHYQLEHDLGLDTGVTVYNTQAVERIVKETPKMLPEWKIDEKKDYVWNEQRVQDIINQGIIQGESIPQIADRLCQGLQTTNEKKMLMFARTAVNGAHNAGRIEAMRQQRELGIQVQKRWLATRDKRTRDAHKDLNGRVADLDAPFHAHLRNGQAADILYPGDPNAEPELVYNCRCTLTYFYPEIQKLPPTVKKDEEVTKLTYEQWIEAKENREMLHRRR